MKRLPVDNDGIQDDIAQQPPDPQSARRTKTFRSWAKVTGGYFLVSLAVVEGLLSLLDWYHVPASAESVLPRLIIASGIMVILATAASTLAHMTLYYRHRYHIQRDRGYVKDLHPDRIKLMSRYASLMAKAQGRFRAVGISLHTLLSDTDFETWVRKALVGNKNLNITLVFAKPYTHFIRHREKVEGKSEGRISQDCLRNTSRALAVKRKLGDDASRLHIYQVDSLSPAFILQKDEELYFEPYLQRNAGRACPVFVLQRNENNSGAFDKLAGHIDALIEELPELTTAVQCPGTYHTPFGQLASRRSLKRALFLDRDGVIVNDIGYISSPDLLQLRTSVVKALHDVQDRFRLIVVTNQSGVARGFFSETDLREIHIRLLAMLDNYDVHLDAIYYCPHHPTEGEGAYRAECEFRKPKPGLILRGASDHGVNLSESWMIGDSMRDIEAGLAAGTHTMLIGQRQGQSPHPERCVDDAEKLADELRRLV